MKDMIFLSHLHRMTVHRRLKIHTISIDHDRLDRQIWCHLRLLNLLLDIFEHNSNKILHLYFNSKQITKAIDTNTLFTNFFIFHSTVFVGLKPNLRKEANLLLRVLFEKFRHYWKLQSLGTSLFSIFLKDFRMTNRHSTFHKRQVFSLSQCRINCWWTSYM